mgnify:FL=1
MTLLEPEKIMELEETMKTAPETRAAQKALATEVVRDVHGEEELNKVMKITDALFSGNLKELTGSELHDAFSNIPSYEINEDKPFIDLLVEAGVATSRREAREFISGNAISLNGEKETNLELVITKENILTDNFMVIRKGKKKYFVVQYK